MNFYGRPIRPVHSRVGERDRKNARDRKARNRWVGNGATRTGQKEGKREGEKKKSRARKNARRERERKIYTACIRIDRYGHRFSGRAPIALISPATRNRRFCAKRTGRPLVVRPPSPSPSLPPPATATRQSGDRRGSNCPDRCLISPSSLLSNGDFESDVRPFCFNKWRNRSIARGNVRRVIPRHVFSRFPILPKISRGTAREMIYQR